VQATITSTKTYTLSCSWPGADTITLSWIPPSQNDDGSALTDLAGFRVYYSQTSGMSVNQVKTVATPGATGTVIGPGLAPGPWYVVVSAYNTPGAESVKVPSPPLTKTLAPGATVGQSFKVTFPNAPSNFTVQ
jgi:hypothetical protein